MNKKLLFSLLLAGTAFTGHADEARLLRFPAHPINQGENSLIL